MKKTTLYKAHLGLCTPPSTSFRWPPREGGQCWASWSTPATPAAPSWSHFSSTTSTPCTLLHQEIENHHHQGPACKGGGLGQRCLPCTPANVVVDVGLTEFSAGLTTRRCCTGARKPPQPPPQLFPFFLLFVLLVFLIPSAMMYVIYRTFNRQIISDRSDYVIAFSAINNKFLVINQFHLLLSTD